MHKMKGVWSCDECTRKDLASGLYGQHLHRNGQSAATVFRVEAEPYRTSATFNGPEPTPSHVLDMIAMAETRMAL